MRASAPISWDADGYKHRNTECKLLVSNVVCVFLQEYSRCPMQTRWAGVRYFCRAAANKREHDRDLWPCCEVHTGSNSMFIAILLADRGEANKPERFTQEYFMTICIFTKQRYIFR